MCSGAWVGPQAAHRPVGNQNTARVSVDEQTEACAGHQRVPGRQPLGRSTRRGSIHVFGLKPSHQHDAGGWDPRRQHCGLKAPWRPCPTFLWFGSVVLPGRLLGHGRGCHEAQLEGPARTADPPTAPSPTVTTPPLPEPARTPGPPRPGAQAASAQGHLGLWVEPGSGGSPPQVRWDHGAEGRALRDPPGHPPQFTRRIPTKQQTCALGRVWGCPTTWTPRGQALVTAQAARFTLCFFPRPQAGAKKETPASRAGPVGDCSACHNKSHRGAVTKRQGLSHLHDAGDFEPPFFQGTMGTKIT